MKSLRFLLMFVLILGYGSVLEIFYSIYIQIFELLLLLVILLLGKKKQLKGNYKKYFLIIYSCVFVSAIMTRTSPLNYVSFLVRPIIGLFLLSAYDYNFIEIKYYYKKCLRVIAILAAANFFIATVANPLFVAKTSDSGYTVNTIGYIFNYIVSTERLGMTFVRNQGFFWEPGVLVVLMNLYIFILLFEEPLKLKRILLPLFVILTTASTSGYIVFTILLLIWYLRRIKGTNGHIGKRILIVISAVIVLGILSPIIFEEVKYKTTIGVGSTNKRMFDMMMGAEVAMDNPLFGIGPVQERYLAIQNKYNVFVGEDANVSYDARQNSNIFVMLFAFYGIPMALLFIYGLYRQNVFTHKKIFIFITVIALISEPVAFIDLYFLWIMSGSYEIKSLVN